MTVTTSTGIVAITDPAPINLDTAGDQYTRDIVDRGGGLTTVLYSSGSSLMLSHIGADGVPSGAAVMVTDLATYGSLPVAVALTNGNIVVVWELNLLAQYRLFDSNLNPLTAELNVETSASFSRAPDVAPMVGGGFVIAWEGFAAGQNSETHFRRFDATGASADPVGGYKFGLSADDENRPSVAVLANGNIAFGWEVVRPNSDVDAAYAVVNASNQFVIPPTLFDSTGALNWNLDLAALPGGGFVVTHMDETSSGEQDITTRFILTSGGTVQTSTAGGTQTAPETFIGPDGSILITYADTTTRATLLSSAGEVIFSDLDLGAAGQPGAHVAWLDSERLVIASSVLPTAPGGGDFDGYASVATVWEFRRTSTGDAANDVIDFQADARKDIVNAGAGDDSVHGGDGDDTLIGGAGLDTLYGDDDNDYLIGGDGVDTLYGGGGTNTLQGGPGNDNYQISNSIDSIIEFDGEGTDTVWLNGVYVYTLPSNVENVDGSSVFLFPLTAIGNGLDNNVIGTFDAADTLFGRNGNDVLNGRSGPANTLLGGLGNDIYDVQSVGDSTIELPGEGIDTVRTSFSIYGLQANIDNLIFTDNLTHLAGVGNVLNNEIYGGTGRDDLFGREGDDRLSGGSGTPNTMLGQEGNDTYVVRAVGDSILEFANQGTDTVEAEVASFTLPSNVEHLTRTSSAAFVGIGNALFNNITGASGADFLSGLDGNDQLTGGGSADELLGGAGEDVFRYLGGETGFDRIYDFTSGQDRIALSTLAFTPTPLYALVQGALPVANSTNSTFLYNSANGMLHFDVDGTGPIAPVALAQLNAGLTLGLFSDFTFF